MFYCINKNYFRMSLKKSTACNVISHLQKEVRLRGVAHTYYVCLLHNKFPTSVSSCCLKEICEHYHEGQLYPIYPILLEIERPIGTICYINWFSYPNPRSVFSQILIRRKAACQSIISMNMYVCVESLDKSINNSFTHPIAILAD